MFIDRCSDQAPETLETFFRKFEGGLAEAGRALLELIGVLRALPDDRRVWALTSHLRVVLLAQDSFRASWSVVIGAVDRRNLWVEYLLPSEQAPWPGAVVKGDATSVEKAAEMVPIAMERCGAQWARASDSSGD